MKYANSITDLIGKTPLLKANNIIKKYNFKNNVFLKLECFNPLSSVKDRIGLSMIEDAISKGILTSDTTIIEPTSGNTGIALAYICATKKFRLILTMPSSMSIERQKIIKSFGAEIVLTPPQNGMNGAIEKAKELQLQIDNSIILSQFSNPANPHIHKTTTAQEIISDLDGKIDIFVSGVGTGGTISGVGETLKYINKNTLIYAVEPSDSPVISKGVKGPHKIQGIGAGFIPDNLNTNIYDFVHTATYEESVACSRELAKEEGILVGISSGAAMSVAIKIAQQPEYVDKNIVVILPDTGERYLSTDLFDFII